MSKNKLFENKAFEKTSVKTEFNLVAQTSNFHSVFNVKPLDEVQSQEIDELLGAHRKEIDNKQVEKDAETLKMLTSEILSIGKQATLLIGERVHRARELLKSYTDGTFSKWLQGTFGNRKNGYNMLSYYELYSEIQEEELRETFKKLNNSTAYILASREGDLVTKFDIIRDHYNKPHHDVVAIIQEKLPLSVQDKRTNKSYNDTLIVNMLKMVKRLSAMRLSEKNKEDLNKMSATLMELIG